MSYLKDFKRMAVGREMPSLSEERLLEEAHNELRVVMESVGYTLKARTLEDALEESAKFILSDAFAALSEAEQHSAKQGWKMVFGKWLKTGKSALKKLGTAAALAGVVAGAGTAAHGAGKAVHAGLSPDAPAAAKAYSQSVRDSAKYKAMVKAGDTLKRAFGKASAEYDKDNPKAKDDLKAAYDQEGEKTFKKIKAGAKEAEAGVGLSAAGLAALAAAASKKRKKRAESTDAILAFNRMAVGRELPALNEGVEHDDFSRALVNGVRAARGLPATPAAEAAQKRDFQSIMADIEQTTSDISKKKLTVKAGKAKLDALWREMAAVQGALPEERLAEADDEVYTTIVKQLAGGFNKLRAMLGAKIIEQIPKGVGIEWPNKQASKGNRVEITLRGDDTYDMEFFNVRGGGKKSVKKMEGLYADALKSAFEQQTGWYLSL